MIFIVTFLIVAIITTTTSIFTTNSIITIAIFIISSSAELPLHCSIKSSINTIKIVIIRDYHSHHCHYHHLDMITTTTILITTTIIITTNIIIAIIITTHTIIRTELNCMEQDDKQLLAGLREEFLQAPSYEVLLFYSFSDLRIFIFLIA